MEKSSRKIENTPGLTIKNALHRIFEGGWSVKRAASEFNIPRTTLRRYVAKYNQMEVDVDFARIDEEGALRLTPNYDVNRVFSDAEENKLTDYLKNMANLHYGLSPKQVRFFAYELAVAYNKKIPNAWITNKCAGKKWFTT